MDLKELEKKNDIYVALKEKLTTIKEEATKIKNEINNTSVVLTKEEIETKKKKLEEYREQLVAIQDEMNKLIEELMQDPEIRKQLEEALALAREKAVQEVLNEIAKKKKEKEELTKQKNKLDKIIIAIKENATVKDALIKVLKCKLELIKLKNEIEGCTIRLKKVAIKSELTKKALELSSALVNLKEEADKVNIKIDNEDIEKIMGFIKNEDDIINLDGTLNKYSEDLNQQINGKTVEIDELEQKIKPPTFAKSKKEKTITYCTTTTPYTAKTGTLGSKKTVGYTTRVAANVDRGENKGTYKTGVSVEEDKKEVVYDTTENVYVEEKDKNDNKPHWWNVLRGIRIWNAIRKQKREANSLEGKEEMQLAEQSTIDEGKADELKPIIVAETSQVHKEQHSNKREDLMKYLIVQDAYKIMEEKARQDGTIPTITREERE